MGEYTNLSDLFGDIADAIRSKTGDEELIQAESFPEAIAEIPTGSGGGAASLITKTITSYDDVDGEVDSIGGSVFYECYSLSSVNFPACSSIGPYAFYSCISLDEISFFNCEILQNNAFAYCTSLESADFPSCTVLEDCAFYRCYSLAEVNLPQCSTLGLYAFNECSALTSISLPNCTEIGGSAFRYCQSLSAMYLMGSEVVTLGDYGLIYTPMEIKSYLGDYGSIYVPESLYDSYIAEKRWSGYIDRIVGV